MHVEDVSGGNTIQISGAGIKIEIIGH
uniref:Pectate lyase n=1 Tax=Meloidogyne floridensis TaxID=298350 RepID=A0A915PAU0_9BILA